MRYSKQREAVYAALKNTDCHPDAEWVYGQVKKTIQGVSLGTVYRNLKLLTDSQKLITIETQKNTAHYDADLTPHSHFVCESCKKIFDVFETPEPPKILDETGFQVNTVKSVYYGVCGDCLKNLSEQKISDNYN